MKCMKFDKQVFHFGRGFASSRSLNETKKLYGPDYCKIQYIQNGGANIGEGNVSSIFEGRYTIQT